MAGNVPMIDYKLLNGPAGSLFPQVDSRDKLASFEVAADKLSFYREQGYLPNIKVLDKVQLEALLQGMHDMTADDYPRRKELSGLDGYGNLHAGTRMIYFQGAWLVNEAYHDVIYNPAITVVAAQLMQTDSVRFWHDQIFYKPARHGGVVAWHQDYSYWTRTVPMGHLTCFIALDDTTLENGCLHAVPGSQNWPLLPMTQLFDGESAAKMERIKTVLDEEQLAQFKPVPIMLKAGECSFHHPLTVHGSYANGSERPRRALVLNFMLPTTESDSDEPLMPGSKPVPRGKIVENEYFPIVFNKSKLN